MGNFYTVQIIFGPEIKHITIVKWKYKKQLKFNLELYERKKTRKASLQLNKIHKWHNGLSAVLYVPDKENTYP